MIWTKYKNKTRKIRQIEEALNAKNKVLFLDNNNKVIKLNKKGWEH